MALVTFVGDPRDGGSGPAVYHLRGRDYRKGRAIQVDDEAEAARLRRHTHFVVVDGSTPAPKAAKHAGLAATPVDFDQTPRRRGMPKRTTPPSAAALPRRRGRPRKSETQDGDG